MPDAIYVPVSRPPRPLLEKLGVESGHRVSLVSIDDPEFIGALESVSLRLSRGRVLDPSDLIFFGAQTRDDLRRLAPMRKKLDPAGALWVIRPKGSKEISESDVIDMARSSGLVDNKVVRFSDSHTAERLVIPRAQRKSG